MNYLKIFTVILGFACLIFSSCEKMASDPEMIGVATELEMYKKFSTGSIDDNTYSTVVTTPSGSIICSKETIEKGLSVNKFNSSEQLEWSFVYGVNQDTLLPVVRDIILTKDEDLVFAVYGAPFRLIKISRDGELLWGKNISFSGKFSIEDIYGTDDDGFIISGLADQNKPYIMKFDGNGQFKWKSETTIDLPSGIAQTDDGYITAGFNLMDGFDQYISDKLFIERINKNGIKNQITSVDAYEVEDIIEANNGGSIILTKTSDDTIELVKVNTSNEIEWKKSHQFDLTDTDFKIKKLLTTGYYVIKTKKYIETINGFGVPRYNHSILKFNNSGDMID